MDSPVDVLTFNSPTFLISVVIISLESGTFCVVYYFIRPARVQYRVENHNLFFVQVNDVVLELFSGRLKFKLLVGKLH